MKKHLFRYSALAVAMGLSFSVAAVAGASTGTIDTSGPDSYNKVEQSNKTKMFIKNTNQAAVNNNVSQMAHSGEAEVEHNTTGGGAMSGDASNANAVAVSYMVNNCDNCGLGGALPAGNANNSGTIDTSGPDSYNKVEFENETFVMVHNTNDLQVNNNVSQKACSGEAEVEGNTTAGSATSGDATNTNTVTTTLNITN